jgi:hypothetical protein
MGIAELTDDEIVGEVDKGCRQVLLKPDAPPPKVVGMKVWPTAIPQYELGHLEMMDKLHEIEKTIDGLWVCGNYRSGVAFPDCVTFGYDHAKVVIDHLKNSDNVASVVMEEEAITETATEEEVALDEEEEEVVVAAVEDDVEEDDVDISIPYDAAAKLAYEASDKSMAYDDFKIKYEAEAVELVKSKQPSNDKEEEEVVVAAVEDDVEEDVVDISIPYDAAAKLAYEASDKSMAYDDFKIKYEAEAVELVKSKQPSNEKEEEEEIVVAAVEEDVVDISIPYDAAAKLA